MHNQIEFRHLRYFLAVATELHYRKAAEKLFISQPGLSKQITQLEDQLGVKLFQRTKREVNLTKSGAYLKEHVEYLEGYLETVFTRLQSIEDGKEGEIKVGFVGSAMENVIPELMVQCHKLYPNIRFELHEMSNEDQILAIQNNTIDIGFVRMEKAPDNIIIKEILSDYFALVLPKSHAISIDNFKRIKQLSKEKFILFSKNFSSSYYDELMSIFEDAKFRPEVSHKSVHANTIFKLVENGLGIAICSLSLTQAYKNTNKIIPLTNIKQRAILSVAWRKGNYYPALEKVLSLIKLNAD